MTDISSEAAGTIFVPLYRMSPTRFVLLLALMALSAMASAQTDSTRADTSRLVVKPAPQAASTDTAMVLDWRARHQPERAAIYSAILPGAGQIYNRKYWKVPIVLGGLGVCYYFIHDNTKQYERYKTAYLADVDNDPNTIDEFNGAYSPDALRNVADTYHRWRDLSYLSFTLVYVLNVMDAAVDGYFVRFNVSRDLSLDLRPSVPLAARGAFGLSLSMRL